MRRIIRLRCTALLLAIGLPCSFVWPAGEKQEAVPPSSLIDHMHEHLDQVSAIKSAVIAGQLDQVREPANWLSTHDEPVGLPKEWMPFVENMRRHAAKAAAARDLTEAAKAVSEIGRACGECHRNSGIQISFGYDTRPSPENQTLTSQMQRHLWAADRMWESLIGPSDRAWKRGIAILSEVHLTGGEITDTGQQSLVDDLVKQVREVGSEGAKAITSESRGTVYGEFLSLCASCHSVTGGGPAGQKYIVK